MYSFLHLLFDYLLTTVNCDRDVHNSQSCRSTVQVQHDVLLIKRHIGMDSLLCLLTVRRPGGEKVLQERERNVVPCWITALYVVLFLYLCPINKQLPTEKTEAAKQWKRISQESLFLFFTAQWIDRKTAHYNWYTFHFAALAVQRKKETNQTETEKILTCASFAFVAAVVGIGHQQAASNTHTHTHTRL